MQKQKNNITTKDLINKLYIIRNNHNINWQVQHLFWLQDSIISESVNFAIFHKILSQYQLRDYEKYPFKSPYGQWRKYNNKAISSRDMLTITSLIISKLKHD